MSSTPSYAGILRELSVQLSAANTNLDGTGTLVEICRGAASGSRVARVRLITALATASAANKITFFISYDGGTTKRFLCDWLLQAGAITPSATVASAYAEVPQLVGKELQDANARIYAGSWIAQLTNVDVDLNDL